MKKIKPKKTSTIVVLIILFVLLIGIVITGLFVYKNHNSIMAMYYMYTNKVVDLEHNKLNTDEKALDAIKEYGIENIRPLTEEESEKLNSGEMSEEEAVDIVLGRDEKTEASDAPATSENSEGRTSGNAENDEEIARLIGQMYVLKAKFTDELAAIEKWVEDQYWIYTKEYGEGNVPYSVKAKIGKAAYNKALSLEAECDTQVESILSQLTTLLKESGQSTSVVDEMKAAYENEKMLAKTKYMNKI